MVEGFQSSRVGSLDLPLTTDVPSRGFRAFTWLVLLACCGLLAFGLTHRSATPDLLGRYSYGYAAVLAILAALAGYFCFLLWRPRSRLVEWTKNAYAFAIATAIALLGAELGLRTFAPWGIDFFHWLPYHMQGMVSDPELGYVHPKGVSYSLGKAKVVLNSHGMRGEEIVFDKPAGERRILVLGDSVAFGWGVSQGETFSDRMEPLLRARTGERWRVVNAGVNGYNSEQQAVFLESRGWRYAPDVVVLVFVDNDVDPRLVPNEATWRRYPQWPASLPESIDRLRQLSYLNQITHLMARLQSPPSDGAQRSITAHPRWPEAHKALRRIAAGCQARGIPLLVAHLSGDAQFLAALDRDGIAAISLGPAWERVAPEQRRVSRVDPHPAAPVHAAFADMLVTELGDRGWIGTRAVPAQDHAATENSRRSNR
jgi:lysophospholipase L1-like esterase